MPIIEYECDSIECGFKQEEITAHPIPEFKPCPMCDAGVMKRVMSTFGGYHIKGNNSASVRPKGAGASTKKGKT